MALIRLMAHVANQALVELSLDMNCLSSIQMHPTTFTRKAQLSHNVQNSRCCVQSIKCLIDIQHEFNYTSFQQHRTETLIPLATS